jgi:hypothetical protein
MMKYFTFISMLVLLFSQPTMLWAGSYQNSGHARATDTVVICTNQHKTRILTLEYLVAGSRVPCQVIYEKPTEQPGYREVLWKAQKKVGYCEQKMNHFVRNKLEGQWGWHCSTEHNIPAAPKGKAAKDTDNHADNGYICTQEKGSRVNLRIGPGTHFSKGVIRGDSEWLQKMNYTTKDGARIEIYSKTRGEQGYFWYLVGQSWVAWVRSDMVCRY